MKVRERLQIMMRSLCVDAVWNFRRHQNVGFLFMVSPMLKKCWEDRDAFILAMKRQARYISTHPVMTVVLAGWVVKSEEGLRDRLDRSPQELQRVKGMMMGPLAALGDAFFWSALKPLTLLVGVACVVLGGSVKGKVWGVVTVLVAYNAVRFWVMWKGVTAGYERGISAMAVFQSFPGWVSRLQGIGVITASAIAALLYPWTSVSVMGHEVVPGFLALATVACFLVGLRLRISSTVLLYFAVGGCIVLGYVVPLREVFRMEVPW